MGEISPGRGTSSSPSRIPGVGEERSGSERSGWGAPEARGGQRSLGSPKLDLLRPKQFGRRDSGGVTALSLQDLVGLGYGESHVWRPQYQIIRAQGGVCGVLPKLVWRERVRRSLPVWVSGVEDLGLKGLAS